MSRRPRSTRTAATRRGMPTSSPPRSTATRSPSKASPASLAAKARRNSRSISPPARARAGRSRGSCRRRAWDKGPWSSAGPPISLRSSTIATRFGGGGTAFLSRSTANSSIAEVVPHNPDLVNVSYEGASADGSTVIFNAIVKGGGLASGAIPDEFNLYAWDRETGEIRLAGVLPDGSAPPSGTQAGFNGTPASPRTTTRSQATARSTSTTARPRRSRPAQLGQLYLRLNPTEPETTQKDIHGNCIPDPVLACTINVSASEKTNGALNGHDAAGTQPAVLHDRGPGRQGSLLHQQ